MHNRFQLNRSPLLRPRLKLPLAQRAHRIFIQLLIHSAHSGYEVIDDSRKKERPS